MNIEILNLLKNWKPQYKPEQNQMRSLRMKIDKCSTPKVVEAKSTCDGPRVVCSNISHSDLDRQ